MSLYSVLDKFKLSDDIQYTSCFNSDEVSGIADEFDCVEADMIYELYDNNRRDVQTDGAVYDRLNVIVKSGDADRIQKGEAALSQGRVALFVMAGGMGSRLGFDKPKGMFELSDGISLFEIIFKRLLSLEEKTKKRAHVFIMTSKLNDDITREYFVEKDYFDYGEDYVHFFVQGELPPITVDRKFLLDDDKHILTVPDGNGGIFRAISTSGVKDILIREKIEYINIVGIDNVLLQPLDPEFIGATILNDYVLSSKSVTRNATNEKVGYLMKKNGKPHIVEYTEVSDDMRARTLENGEFYYADGSVLNHLFKVDVLLEVLNYNLPYHVAFKKVGYFDGEKHIAPSEPNAYKYEQFIFDIFEKFDDMLVFRTERSKEFSPLKNKTGVDSIESARRDFEREGI